MVEPASVGTLQPTLPVRPPTSPRESNRNESKGNFIKRFFLGDSASKRNSLTYITPESSAESPAASPSTSLTARKKVGWSNSTQYSDDPRASLDGKPQATVHTLTPSAERKPTKSILKAHNGGQDSLEVNSPLLPPHQHKNFAAMLESIVQQLAGKDRGGKMDAYLMLAGSLKASASLPDPIALREKMSLLLQFITRDVKEKAENGRPDTPLVINALQLLSSLLSLSDIAGTIGGDFGVFMIEHATNTFEDPSMSKDIVKHLAFGLSQLKFSPKVMTAERVGRLIENLHTIESFVKGKSIVMGRINIYRNLLRQSRIHMITHPLWLEDLFADMMSNVKEIRTLAIAFGLESSYSLGNESKVSRAVTNLFQIEQEGGGKFAIFYSEKLKTAVQKKEEMMTCVPQICSIIFLFLRGKPRQLEQWSHLTSYLAVFQLCFNSGDTSTRIEANYAWNRFVVAIQPDENTKKSLINMLAQPLLGQLKLRRSNRTRKTAIGSVCNLLYYTLKPNTTPPQLDFFWDSYVVSIIGQCLTPTNMTDPQAKEDLLEACSILQNLFDSGFQRPWNENRVMANYKESSVAAKELPALDPKWLRRNSTRIFPVLVPIIHKLFLELGDDSEIFKLWVTYVRWISFPAKMEVKVSNDTMSCLASIFELFYKTWRAGPNNIGALPAKLGPSNAQFLKSFEKMVTTITATTNGLGILPFTQRDLCIGTQDTFIPVATPSQRPDRLKGEIRKPLHHLFCLLATDLPNLVCDDDFIHMAYSILLPFFEAQQSNRLECIKLATDLLSLLPTESTPSTKGLWEVIADFVTTAVEIRDSEKIENPDQPLGKYYQSVVKILDAGIRYSPQEALAGWKTLFDALASSATVDSGISGKAIVVLEPVAKCLLLHQQNSTGTIGISYYSLLVSKVGYPKNQQALDAARKHLWGSAMAGPKLLTFDPFVKLYEYIKTTMVFSYTNFDKTQLADCSDMIAITTEFMGLCPAELIFGSLVKIQEGVSHWVVDTERKIGSGNPLSKSINSFWDAFCNLIPRFEELYGCSKILAELEALICAGIDSTHKSIAIRAVKMWNTTFGVSEEAFEYTERAQASLLRIHAVADIQLPFIPESVLSEAEAYAQEPMQYAETQEDSAFLPTTSMEFVMKNHRTPQNGSSPMIRKMRETTPEVVIQMSTASRRKRPREDTPEMSGRRKSRRRQSTSKLRHDDSQVQFQAIESSPVANGATSTSQLLTDRQKEVKERQIADAAMFPDLKTSPDFQATAKMEIEAEPQLPPRRSSSKPGKSRSPRVEIRQTTPTPLPPSEDDTFIISSPTPKRSSRLAASGRSGGGSPSLIVPVPEKDEPVPQIEISSVEEVPSSPPEIPGRKIHGPMSSVEVPSAQVQTYAVLPEYAMSTYQSTEASQNHDTTYDAGSTNPNFARVDEEALQDSIMEDADFPSEDNADMDQVLPMEIDEALRPSTPTRTEIPKSSHRSSTSPPFVDARSSPVSSDKLAPNEDFFEDTRASPRSNVLRRGHYKQQPRSDSRSVDADESMDESSLIRMMQTFDANHQPPVSTIPGTESPRRATRSSSRRNTLQDVSINSPAPRSIHKTALANAAAKEPGNPTNGHESKSDILNKPTSVEPIVPDTLSTNSMNIPKKNSNPEESGIEAEVNETIVVDVSAFENMDRGSVSRRSSRRRESLFAGFDKGDGVLGDASEIPETQQVLATFPSPKVSPIESMLKKKRGRPRKSLENKVSPTPSREAIQFPEATQSERLAKNLRTPSIDLDAPPDLGFDIVTPSNSKSRGNKVMEGRPMSFQQPEKATGRRREEKGREKVIPSSPSPEAETAEGSIGGNEEAEASGSAARQASQQPTKENAAEEALPGLSGGSPAISKDKATFKNVELQMMNLIGNLDMSELSKDQVNKIENLFMDAKEKLYGAARRGRQVGL
ncbi:hypothetical protein HYALB_00008508 [Hymenoscyphus albidus]|uniref:Telomere-associated protein Rif1 N-terminal domain-containing protein n=1 Tax=Hymenoscyphus albidus TaxID=595503 RepID=A0A9N9PXV2_9HELO|nr:hypothetical protein HYALB_00008508 [Hymenoscyphus albidus]